MDKISEVFKYHKKIPNEKIFNVMNSLENGVILPKKEDCINLITNLKHFIESYSEEDIERINHDINCVINGDPPDYIITLQKKSRKPPEPNNEQEMEN